MNRQRQPPAPPMLYVAQGADGENVSFGQRQVEWLEAEGLVTRGKVEGSVNRFTAATGLTALELHQAVWANPEMRECDFCMEPSAPWIVNSRAFNLTLGSAPGPVGGPHRPLVACEECAVMIRENRKEALVESAISKIIVRVRTGGNEYLRTVVASHSMKVLRDQIRPQVRETVYGMFANRQGFPTKETP